MSGWMNGWMGGWMNGWMDEWVDGCIDLRPDGWIDRCMYGWMDVVLTQLKVITELFVVKSTSNMYVYTQQG